MRCLWATDLHLNFISSDDFMVFIDKFMEKPSDAMIITGDIAEGDSFHEYLALMAEAYKKPIYYVLGNHDYYKRSFAEVKEQVKLLDSSAKYKNLFCMDNNGIVKLTDKTCLVGYGGWYFSCKAAGEALLDVMEGQPENKNLTVVCGHSHYKAFLKVSDQISVYVADAQYYYPKIYTTLEIA